MYQSINAATDPMLSWWDIAATISFIALFLIIANVVYNARWHPIAHVPGPLLGRISPIWIASSLWKGTINTDLRDVHTKFGPIVRIAPNEISFASVDSLETIYHGANPRTEHFLKAHQEMFHIVLPGPSIFTAHEVTEHRRMRRKIEPALSAKALSKQEDLVRKHIEVMCEAVEHAASIRQGNVNITDVLSTHMFNLVSDLAFGEPLVKGKKNFEDFLDNFRGLLTVYEFVGFIVPFVSGMLRLVLQSLPATFLTMDFIKADRLRAQMTKSEGRGDFLAAIMDDQKSTGTILTDSELRGNSMFLFGAGYATSSIAMAATLYHVLREPLHIQRLSKEIRESFPSSEDIDGLKLQQLTYLNACINESMRLLPPLNLRFASRVSPGAVISGVYVPKGVIVSADIFTMQRSEEYWAHACEFRPERWLDAGPDTPYYNDNKATFKPFLLGERLCPGKQMLYHVARLVLANLLFKFDMSLLDRDEFVWERDVRGTALWTDCQRLNVRVSRSSVPQLDKQPC